MEPVKFFARTLAALAGIYALLCAAMYGVMIQTPDRFGAIMAHVPGVAFMVLPFEPLWMRARSGSLQIGDAAPDFELPTVTHQAVVKLSAEFRTKPVVLVFGSYT